MHVKTADATAPVAPQVGLEVGGQLGAVEADVAAPRQAVQLRHQLVGGLVRRPAGVLVARPSATASW